jgi:hypothetical protein
MHGRSGQVLLLAVACAIVAAFACGGTAREFPSEYASADGGKPKGPPTAFAEAGVNGPYTDFPPPILDAPDGTNAPPVDSEKLFGSPINGSPVGGPCIVEPEMGTLYPKNWLRPRFRWVPAFGQTVFELRLHVDNQTRDLVVYTTQTSWTMPKEIWDALRNHSADQGMTLTIRGAERIGSQITSIAMGSQGTIGVAPADAPGSIVYWTTSGDSSLKGFSVGDESVVQVLTPGQIQQRSSSCVGCHTGTPDGKFTSVGVPEGTWSNVLASIEPSAVGAAPNFLGAGGKAALEREYLGIAAFSPAHWTSGDRIELVSMSGALTWINIEDATPGSPTSTGTVARTGDARKAGAPTWSHDGKTIAYVSTDGIRDGRLDTGPADLWSVPYANKAGGVAQPIPGADLPDVLEYYPAFSPDDRWLAFNRARAGATMYDEPEAEVFMIPAAGGTATRLFANDPPACSGKVSPGVTNSWPKWAPNVVTVGARTFYFLVFSSTRAEAKKPQLYMSTVVVEGNTITTYAALYLWNQPATENNHTPAWDMFDIPSQGPR